MQPETEQSSAGFSLQEYLGILRRRRAIILQAFVIIAVVGVIQALMAKNVYESTHGIFSRDVVLPSLGEDPAGYRQLEAEWMAQLPPRTLLERHYVEKIAAASWRLRRLHRWQAQLFEDDTLTEDERLNKLDKVLRHETALHRQIDTAVKMLHKDAPQLFAQRARDQVLEDIRIAEREYRSDPQDAVVVDLEIQNRLSRIRKATEQAAADLSHAPLDTVEPENCKNELPLGLMLASSLPPSSRKAPAAFFLAPPTQPKEAVAATHAPQIEGGEAGGGLLVPQTWGGGATSVPVPEEELPPTYAQLHRKDFKMQRCR